MKDVLAGIRVLDFCWVGAGALVTKLLAEHGADVIKVESRARPDNLRVAPPFRPGAEGLDGSGYFASRNNDKRSLVLNMSKPKARELARQLAASCDLVTNNFRPGVMERWGLGYADVREANPSAIYLSMPMQGAEGPHSSYVGFGSTIAALAGLVNVSGKPERDPVGTGTHYPDHIPSPGHALVAVLAAIRRRNLTGEGCLVEVSQFESAVELVGPALIAVSTGAPEPLRNGNRVAAHSPSGVFRCAGSEDQWCAIAATSEDEWRDLADVLGQPDLGDDPRFATLAARKENEDALEELLAPLVRAWERWSLTDALQQRGVAAWPVLNAGELLEDEQLLSRDFWRTLDHSVMGQFTAAAAPFKNGDARTGPVDAAPLLGNDTREIASSLLGLSDQEIDELERDEVFW